MLKKIFLLFSILFFQLSIPNTILAEAPSQKEVKNFFDDVLLIINFNNPYYDNIKFLKETYGPYFKHIVFYGEKPHSEVNVMNNFQGGLCIVL